MKYLYRIIAFLLVFVTIISICSVSVFASDDDYISTSITWWDAVIHSLIREANASNMGFVQTLVAWSSGTACTGSSDGYHHSDSIYGCEIQSDDHGTYVVTNCKYCNSDFKYYSDDLKRSYDYYVGNTPTTGGESGGTFGGRVLPVNIIQKDGTLLWYPKSGTISANSDIASATYSFSDGAFTLEFIAPSPDGYVRAITYFNLCFKYDFPIDGYYEPYLSSVPVYFLTIGRDVSSRCESTRPIELPKINGLQSAGSSSVSRSFSVYYVPLNSGNYIYLSYLFISFSTLYKVTPLSGLIDTQHDETYSPDTRATSFTGDIGIIGDDGQLTKVDGDQIFNETTNNYYNPTTGDTTTVTDWFYDYSDRSYHLTTQEGDTVTVTYGDENITIQEGDQTYNVYYITTYNVSEGDIGEDGHIHQWGTPTDSTPATCTNSGSETYTCSVCGESKIVQIPALGHKWKVLRTVQTKYDESGELVQQGYTLYECERCGEQYKQDGSSTGPPGTSQGGGSSGSDPSDDDGDSIWDKLGKLLGTLGNGALELIGSLVSKLLDGLISLAELIAEKLVDVVNVLLNIFDAIPSLFSGFLDFLSAVFPFLPSEIMLLLTFGMAAIVFIGIIKAVRR